MVKVQDIPFQNLPHQSPLFLRYLDFAPEALRFYRRPPTIASLVDTAKEVLDACSPPRAAIATILRRQNESLGCGPETMRNIDRLEGNDCVAVLTGQQVGLFCGPLYTIYKALTAVRIAEELEALGIAAVPVFWMETEDHDLVEAAGCTLLGTDYSLRAADYREMLFQGHAKPQRSVGHTRFPETIREVVGDYLAHLPDTRWKGEIQQKIESSYGPGATFAEAFARLFCRILGESGMILFDPLQRDAKMLAREVFRKTLLEADVVREALRERNRELVAAGFHVQVAVLDYSTPLFYFHDEDRIALEKKGSTYCLKNKERAFQMEDLLLQADLSPERFSPNVLLRPIIQDHLFPTAAYVAGPAEVAYFAQAEVLYRWWNRPMPVVWPRNSFTLVETEMAEELNDLGIRVQDCFRGRQHLAEKTMRRPEFRKAAAELDILKESLDRELNEIRPEIESVDPTLPAAMDTARRKMFHNIQRLRNRVARLEAQTDLTVSRLLDRLLNSCLPNQKLQERELGIMHFYVRHGPSIVGLLRSSLEAGRFSHRLLFLPPEGNQGRG